VVDFADLARRLLDDRGAEAHLPVPPHGHPPPMSHAHHGGGPPGTVGPRLRQTQGLPARRAHAATAPAPAHDQARGWAASYTRIRRSAPTWVYFWVVASRAWPRSSWISRRSAPASRRCVAKLCRSVCGVTRAASPAARARARTIRCRLRTVRRPPRRFLKSA